MMNASDINKGFREVGKRLDWQVAEINKIPDTEIERLAKEFNTKVGGLMNSNPNIRNEYVINEFSLRTGHGKNLFKPEREHVVYSEITH